MIRVSNKNICLEPHAKLKTLWKGLSIQVGICVWTCCGSTFRRFFNGMKEGYTIITNQLIKGEKLNGYEKMVLIVLIAYRMDNEYCFPSRPLIAENVGFDIKTVDKAIKTLKEKRFIKVKSCGRVNRYYLHKDLKVNKKSF